MTPQECIAALKREGIEATLLHGVPFVPVEAIPTIEATKHALDVVQEMGLGAELWAEGMVLRPPVVR